jgi:hypothetical protein
MIKHMPFPWLINSYFVNIASFSIKYLFCSVLASFSYIILLPNQNCLIFTVKNWFYNQANN